MGRQIVFTAKAAKPPATYSQAVKAAGLVFVSGTAPHDPATGAIKGTTIQEQTRQCLANVEAILEEAGYRRAKARLQGPKLISVQRVSMPLPLVHAKG